MINPTFGAFDVFFLVASFLRLDQSKPLEPIPTNIIYQLLHDGLYVIRGQTVK